MTLSAFVRRIETLCGIIDANRGYRFTAARGFLEYANGRQAQRPTDHRDYASIAEHVERMDERRETMQAIAYENHLALAAALTDAKANAPTVRIARA